MNQKVEYEPVQYLKTICMEASPQKYSFSCRKKGKSEMTKLDGVGEAPMSAESAKRQQRAIKNRISAI